VKKWDVVIIGGGIIGTSAAFFLSKQGADVILIERSEIGREASGASAGSMGLQNKELGAIPLARESLKIWAKLQEELQEDLGFRQCGGLRVAENREQLQLLKRSVAEQRKLGLEIEILSSKELKSFAPYLGPSVVAASLCEKGARGNPLLPSVALAKAAQIQGAEVHIHETVQGIRTNGRNNFLVQTPKEAYKSVCVLNSAGVWSKDIFKMIGLDFPITLSPQQMMVTEQAPKIVSHMISHVQGNLTLKQLDEGEVVIGGGWRAIGDLRRNIKKVCYESLKGNAQYASRVVPALNDLNLIRFWAGLEGRSPDRLPLLGNLHHLSGFYSATCAKGGFTLGPLMGKLVSELILGKKPSFPVAEYDVNRFV